MLTSYPDGKVTVELLQLTRTAPSTGKSSTASCPPERLERPVHDRHREGRRGQVDGHPRVLGVDGETGMVDIEKTTRGHLHTLTEAGKTARRRSGGDGDGGDDGQLQF